MCPLPSREPSSFTPAVASAAHGPLAVHETGPSGPSPPRLLDRVRHAISTRHYSRRTEKAYVHWTKRYIFFHGKRHPMEMGAETPPPSEIPSPVTDLGVRAVVRGRTEDFQPRVRFVAGLSRGWFSWCFGTSAIIG